MTMDPSEITDALSRRRDEYNEVGPEDALEQPVDAEEFWRYVGSIEDIDIRSEETVEVKFREPVPGATNLSDDYGYTIAVTGREHLMETYTRCGMPRRDLITLQQIAITIWALATGAVYNG